MTEAIEFPMSMVPTPDVMDNRGFVDRAKVAKIYAETQFWPPAQRDAFMVSLRAAEARIRMVNKYTGPASIARACDPTFRRTKAIQIIDAAIERVLRSKKKINLMITMPPQEGKQCADDTVVPTPTGWKRHGDLVVGDLVLGVDGSPIAVLAVGDPNDHTDHRVWFSDHSSVVVHARHEWTVFDSSVGFSRTVETSVLAECTLNDQGCVRYTLPRRIGGRGSVCVSSVEKVPPVRGRCITVDSPDGLYLVGESYIPTHNSTLAAVWTPIRALQINADQAIALTTYAQPLAESHSRKIRAMISSHGAGLCDPITMLPLPDKLGLQLAKGANQVTSWGIEGARGGLIAVGIHGTITGRKADLLIIDDPFKNMMEADSEIHRERIFEWYSSVALTRLSPSASVILIQTRWHPKDLAGMILEREKELDPKERTWRHINIPAISEEGIPDTLNRPFGIPMSSARDTPEAKRNFAATRRDVGERTWYALYQGSPRDPSGGIFKAAWFEPRLPSVPDFPIAAAVGVDPADSGRGDIAGIVGGMIMSDGRIALTHDRSGQYTAEEWARHCVVLALEIGALEIAVEGYTAGNTYVNAVRRAYTMVHDKAVAKLGRGEEISQAEHRALPDVPMFRITQWRGPGKADAVARSGLLSQALETGRCRTVEFEMSKWEDEALLWQPGQHQPDRVAAGVICHDRLFAMAGSQMHLSDPAKVQKDNELPPWMTRRIDG